MIPNLFKKMHALTNTHAHPPTHAHTHTHTHTHTHARTYTPTDQIWNVLPAIAPVVAEQVCVGVCVFTCLCTSHLSSLSRFVCGCVVVVVCMCSCMLLFARKPAFRSYRTPGKSWKKESRKKWLSTSLQGVSRKMRSLTASKPRTRRSMRYRLLRTGGVTGCFW